MARLDLNLKKATEREPDVDLDNLTAPAPLDGGLDYAEEPGQTTADGRWFRRGDGHRKWVSRRELKGGTEWSVL